MVEGSKWIQRIDGVSVFEKGLENATMAPKLIAHSVRVTGLTKPYLILSSSLLLLLFLPVLASSSLLVFFPSPSCFLLLSGADEAISSVICDRDAFRSLLVCVPRVVKQREVDMEKRKRKGGAIELRPNKLSKESGDGLRAAKKVCFNFKKEGTCKFGDTCKFAHLKEE